MFKLLFELIPKKSSFPTTFLNKQRNNEIKKVLLNLPRAGFNKTFHSQRDNTITKVKKKKC